MVENSTLPPPAAPSYGASMETRVALLENSITHFGQTLDRLDSRMARMEDRQAADFRLIFGAIITLGIGLAGLIAHGFHWL